MSDSNADLARRELTYLLQLAYSGELGATLAYIGHRHALVGERFAAQRKQLSRVIRDEVSHRFCLLRMLDALGATPSAARERKLSWIGFSISVFCHVGGWFFPMYGAAKLEAQNIGEYEHAARLALVAGKNEWIEALLEMAEVEWDHELVFRQYAESHWLWRWVPHWPLPGARASIRERFQAFANQSTPVVEPVRAPWFVR